MNGLEGLIPVLKPPGMTSHDVVAIVRRVTGVKHVGHAGTLDPAATGVLLLLVGAAAARLSEYLLDLPKVYLAEVRFGQTTDSQDYTGALVYRASDADVRRLDCEAVAGALPRFRGHLEQVPPMVSAVKVGGERLYRLAREGRTVSVPPRPIVIYSLELLEFAAADAGLVPTARLRVTCSRGTYIRTLAHDLGQTLGVGAHLGFLVREAVGSFRLETAWTLEELAARAEDGTLDRDIVPLAEVAGHLPAVLIGPGDVDRVRHGEILPRDAAKPVGAGAGDVSGGDRDLTGRDLSGRLFRVFSPEGDLVAIATIDGDRLRPRKVLRPWDGGRGN